MFVQQDKLKNIFEKNGWELIETQIPNYDWIAEIWAIKSIWSPTDCSVFITFEVDPQWTDRNHKSRGVWCINLMLAQPIYWEDEKISSKIQDEVRFQIAIGRNFEERIAETIEALNNLRLRFNNLNN